MPVLIKFVKQLFDNENFKQIIEGYMKVAHVYIQRCTLQHVTFSTLMYGHKTNNKFEGIFRCRYDRNAFVTFANNRYHGCACRCWTASLNLHLIFKNNKQWTIFK